MMRQPVICSKRSRTSRGRGAEPLMQAHIWEKSRRGRSGWLISATNRVGTPGSTVGRCFRSRAMKGLDIEFGEDQDLPGLGHGPVQADGETEGMEKGDEAHHPFGPVLDAG
jgi:hypothetical protein